MPASFDVVLDQPYDWSRTVPLSVRQEPGGVTVEYDLVIRNGLVVDGSGGPSFVGDIGVVGDQIASIGRITSRGAEEIDAEGHIVAPGFVEVHTHMDAQVFWDSLGTCSAWHGITTSVFGNCGFTLAPCAEKDMDLCLRSLERAEDMSRDVLLAGIDWTWETFPEYLDAVDGLAKGINYAAMIGHSSLRTWAMGPRAFEEEATSEDLVVMCRQLRAALEAGAVGFTTSRSHDHRTSDDKPVASLLANWDEVVALVEVQRDLGVGIFQLINNFEQDPEQRARIHAQLGELAVNCGRPVTFACVSAPAVPELGQEYLALADEVAPRGGRIVGQISDREFATVLSFQTTLPFDSLPQWRAFRTRPLDDQQVALRDPALRQCLVDEAMHGDYRLGIGAEPKAPEWSMMQVVDDEGRHPSVAEIAAARHTTPVDVMIDLSLERGLQQFFRQPFFNMDRARTLEMLRHPRTVIALSDTGAHVSQIVDTSIPTHFLSYWVRDQQEFSWEEGIKKLTADPAALMAFSDRGTLREGFVADLAVIDPATIAPGPVEAARDLPAGGTRLKQKAVGVKASVVAGTILMQDGEHTGAHPGRLIRGPLVR